MRRSTILAIAALFVTALGHAEDWPQWMGSRRDGEWREEGILKKFPENGPKRLWSATVGEGVGGPVIAGDKVLLLDFVPTKYVEMMSKGLPYSVLVEAAHRIVCFDASTGKELWNYKEPTAVDGLFRNYPGPLTAPVVGGGKVFAITTQGMMTCVELATGALVWKKDLSTEPKFRIDERFFGNPVVHGNIVYSVINNQKSTVYALDISNGNVVWKSHLQEACGFVNPIVVGVEESPQLMVWSYSGIDGINAKTGAVLWSTPFQKAFGPKFLRLNESKDQLFVGSSVAEGEFFDLDNTKGTALFRCRIKADRRDMVDPLGIVAFEKNFIYGFGADGRIRCVNATNAEVVWTKETTDVFAYKNPANAGGAFLVKNNDQYFITTNQGDLILATMSPEGYKQISRAHILDKPTTSSYGWPHAAFGNKRCVARNAKEIVCIDLSENQDLPIPEK